METSSSPSASTLAIGVAAPLSGLAADLGREMANAVRMAIDEANASSELPGVRIEAVVSDDCGDETTGVVVAKAFASRDDWSRWWDTTTATTLKAAPIYHRAGVAMIAPIVSNSGLTDSGWTNVFRFTNRDDRTAAAIANQLVERLGSGARSRR